MPSYIRRTGDKAFRKVSIQSGITPKFTDFTGPGEAVQYLPMQVIEILRDDGTTALFHDGSAEIANYSAGGVDRFIMRQNIPRDRLWVRRADGSGIPYKVPADLEVVGGNVVLQIPAGVSGMELCGDKYFEMIYQLQKI